MRLRAYSKKKLGRVPWNTRKIEEEVQKRLDSIGFCRINSKWCPQIRGKDLRRLKKKKPDWVYSGRYISENSRK